MFPQIAKNFQYGYIRMSSKLSKNNYPLKFQKQILIEKGIPEKNIRIEIGSIANCTRKDSVFFNLIENELKANSLLVMININHCCRNTLDFFKLQEKTFPRVNYLYFFKSPLFSRSDS